MRFHDKSSAQMVCARTLFIVLLASFSVFSSCTTSGKEESSIPKTYNTGTMGSDPIYTAATTTTLSAEKILDQQLQAYRYENIASVNLPDGGKLTCDQKVLTYTPKSGSPKRLLTPLKSEKISWLSLRAVAPDGKSCQVDQSFVKWTENSKSPTRESKHLLLHLETGKTAEIPNGDSFIWSPNGKYLSYNNSETGVLYLLDVSSMTHLDLSWLPKAAGILFFSPNSKMMAVGTETGETATRSIHFCDLETKKYVTVSSLSIYNTPKGLSDNPSFGGWLDDERFVAQSVNPKSGDPNYFNLIYDVKTGKSVGSVKDQLGLDLIYATSSDAAFCLAQKDGKPVIYQTATKKVTALNTKTAWSEIFLLDGPSSSRALQWSSYEKAFVVYWEDSFVRLIHTDGSVEHRVFYTKNDKGEKVFTNPMPKAVVY